MTDRPAPGWPVLPFEQYMLDDDRPAAPMTFTVVWRLAGRVDGGRLRAAVAAACRQHPLLGCRVDRGRWVPVAGGVPFRLVPANAPRPDPETIDPRRDACLRVALVEPAADAGEWELRLCFHHAVCDGVAAMEFSGDVFTAYRGGSLKTSGRGGSRRDPPVDPGLLADRGRLERPVVPGATWRDAVPIGLWRFPRQPRRCGRCLTSRCRFAFPPPRPPRCGGSLRIPRRPSTNCCSPS
jgi:hypothetical protein